MVIFHTFINHPLMSNGFPSMSESLRLKTSADTLASLE